MPTNFPISLQDLDATRGTNTDPLSSPNHVDHHTLEDQTIEAIQTKLGIDNSADTTSIDYKLKSTSSSNPGHKHTLANGATDVTASVTEINYVAGVTSSIQTQIDTANSNAVQKSTLTTKGDIYAASGASTPVRVAVGVNGQFLKADSGQTAGVTWGDAIASADIQTFSTPGSNTWTKPSGAKSVEVFLFGGGGGGGSGRRESGVATTAYGGGGGAGGGYGYKKFTAASLGSTETVTVGAGGAGGTAQSTNSTNGNAGTAGGASSFGTTVLVKATGGANGTGGTGAGSSNGGTGSQGNGDISVVGGDAGSGSGSNGSQGTDTALVFAPRGGGGGGRGDGNGGAGGAFITNYVLAGGTAGAAGGSPSSGLIIGGTGGGGSNGSAAGTSSAGGAGGSPGGGGGGSGGSGGTGSGAGGAGADGRVIVITYF